MADGYLEFLVDNFGSLDTANYTAFAGMTGDLDLRADRTGFDAGVANDVLVSRWRTAATEKKCWFFGIAFASRLKLWHSSDGTTANAIEQVATSDVPGGPARIQVRVTYNSSTGDATFYTRTDTSLALTDNTGWTQLGSVVAGTAAAVFAGDSTVYPYINAYQSATAGASGAGDWIGKLYQTCVMSGINGTVVSYSDYRTGDWSDLDVGHDDAQTNTWVANDTKDTHWTYVASTGSANLAANLSGTGSLSATLQLPADIRYAYLTV